MIMRKFPFCFFLFFKLFMFFFFFHRDTGFKNTRINAAPWVNALNIAIGAVPVPTLTATPTPTQTPSQTTTSTQTLSQTPTATFVPTPTMTGTPSMSPTNAILSVSPTHTPSSTVSSSFSLTPLISPSFTPSGTQSFSITKTPTETSTSTPTKSFIPQLIPIGQPSEEQTISATPAPSPDTGIEDYVPSPTPLPSYIPDCLNCITGSEEFLIQSSGVGASDDQLIEIKTPDGDPIGTLLIPGIFFDSGITRIDINYITNIPNNYVNADIGNSILDITFFNIFNSEVHIFPGDLEICFYEKTKIDNEICLSYENYFSTWKCEDYDIDEREFADGYYYCGLTPHATNFALLLGGNDNSGTEEYIIAWLSLAFVGLAIILVVVAVFAYEGVFRVKKHKAHSSMKSMQKRIQTQMAESQA